MKTVIEMWHKAWPDAGAFVRASAQDLERLAQLVRADERDEYKWDVHSCGPTCTKAACVAMREAVEAEREACAKVCDDLHPDWKWRAAESIRARSGEKSDYTDRIKKLV